MPFGSDYTDSATQGKDVISSLAQRREIDVRQVSDLIIYDPETGNMVWRERDVSSFAVARIGKGWNTKHAGKIATSKFSGGYLNVCVMDNRHLAHRVAWAIFYQEQPPEIIDHIDRNRCNNAIANLRAVTPVENARNQSKRSDNKSGIGGIWRLQPKKGGKPWAVAMGGDGKMVYKRHRTFCAALKHRFEVSRERGHASGHGLFDAPHKICATAGFPDWWCA